MSSTLVPVIGLIATLISPPEESTAIAAPESDATVVYVVRHAEKAHEGQNAPLTEAGEHRAEVLARMLGDVELDAIYSTPTLRTLGTVAPTARDQELEVAHYRTRSLPDEAALAGKIAVDHDGDALLVCGHSNTVPSLLRSLGANTEGIPDPLEGYDDLFWVVLDRDESGELTRATSHRLRYGEEKAPPPHASGLANAYGLDDLEVGADDRGVVALVDGVHLAIRDTFDRYTRVNAPNGRPIHILAQSGWTLDQIVKARSVLRHMLTDVPGSRYGADKSGVANAMAERRATLVLFDDADALEAALDGPLGELRLGFQDLRANECPVEGSDDYLQHGTRDASFEEILHLVHDYGIRPALPEYDAWIQRLNDRAAAAGIWDPWPEDEPDSHRNEYIAAAYDNYLDLWTVEPTRYEGERLEPDDIPDGTSHFGTYAAGSRGALRRVDPEGLALIESFFPRELLYTAELPDDFRGTFALRLDPSLRYTTKSQHLDHVTLRGEHAAGILGNDRDNRLAGNAGNNVLEGSGGDDQLDGRGGDDTAVFAGDRDDYAIHRRDGVVEVEDRVVGRDGRDLLFAIEHLRFRDGVVEID